MRRRIVAGATALVVGLGSAVMGTSTADAARYLVNCDANSSYLVTFSTGSSRCYAQNFHYVGSAVRIDLARGAAGKYNVQIVIPTGGCTSLQQGIQGLNDIISYKPGHRFAARIYVGTWMRSEWTGVPGELSVDCVNRR
ncbi:hypothetical protein OG474_38670 [Kribbella sp. NBC_01505]|uniref:hypothetical protein n=1 Tax=Kribbella sp. NBC_01505 TaxID=2903580 RepID=UPI0038697F2E